MDTQLQTRAATRNHVVTSHQFRGVPGVVGYPDCPDPTSPINKRVLKAAAAVVEFDAAVAAINDNHLLSEPGKERAKRELLTERQAVMTAVLAARELVDTSARMLRGSFTALFRGNELEPTDLAGALLDQETRTFFRGLSATERATILQRAIDGTNVRIIEALCRSPIPDDCRRFGDIAHHERIEKESPEMIAGMEKLRDTAMWGRDVLQAIVSPVKLLFGGEGPANPLFWKPVPIPTLERNSAKD